MSSSRSCDSCRRRKTRCDGEGLQSRCSRCVEFGLTCTYLTPIQQRGPKNKLVEELRKQIEVLEARLQSRLCSRCARPLDALEGRPKSPSMFHGSPESDSVSTDPGSNKEDATNELADSFRHISISGLNKSKFFALGSSYGLLSSAIDEKEKFLGQVIQPPAVRTLELRRRMYWEHLPWEKRFSHDAPTYVYPTRDLIDSLLDLYFTNVHPIFPVLHRNSFQQSVAEGLHLTDSKFGATLLAVLAVASRYSDDRRVLMPGETSFLGSGWSFVAQVQTTQKIFDPTIHDAQFCCLMTLFGLGTSAPHNSKLFIGIATCCLEYRTRHPGLKQAHVPHTFEDELWNRAFWSVIVLDRMMGAFTGCPPSIHGEDFNFEPLLDIDDDYWEKGFTQPLGKPSLLSFFACFSRLSEIQGDALARLYASKKRKTKMGWVGTQWEVDTVAELDSAMNAFLDSIPPHLRWDPEKKWDPETGPDFDQSAVLYATYYYTQITIHRPYIRKENPLTMSSLSICTSAARSALYIAHVWVNRLQRIALPFLQHSSFVAAIILFLNLYRSKRAGHAVENKKDFAYVAAAIEILRISETRYHPAGRMLEMIQQLLLTDSYASQDLSTHAVFNGPICSGRGVDLTTGNLGSPAGAPEPTLSTYFAPGMTIEQLLAETTSSLDTTSVDYSQSVVTDDTKFQFLEDEIMGMWTAAPADLMNVNQWDAYIENINTTGINWAGVQTQ